MTSSLRNQFLPFTTPASPITRTSTASPPQKKQKMSLTQTYYVAHTARAKLSKEAARGDHDLRLLVGHANLLDGLMLDLANAEQEQESWFNQTVKSNTKAEDPKHVQWADTIPKELEEAVEEEFYGEDSDSEGESDDDEQMEYTQPMQLRKVAQSPARIETSEVDEDEEMEDDEYDVDLALTRSPSHTPLSPPELLHEDSDSESEDDSMPPSPPQTEMPLDAFSDAQRKQAIATTSFYQEKSDSPASLPESEQASFFDEGYYLPQRRQQTAIAAF